MCDDSDCDYPMPDDEVDFDATQPLPEELRVQDTSDVEGEDGYSTQSLDDDDDDDVGEEEKKFSLKQETSASKATQVATSSYVKLEPSVYSSSYHAVTAEGCSSMPSTGLTAPLAETFIHPPERDERSVRNRALSVKAEESSTQPTNRSTLTNTAPYNNDGGSSSTQTQQHTRTCVSKTVVAQAVASPLPAFIPHERVVCLNPQILENTTDNFTFSESPSIIYDETTTQNSASSGERGGTYVLYVMQKSMRTDGNHALEYAVHMANLLKLPLAVLHVLTDDFQGGTERHLLFLLEGLSDVAAALQHRKIGLTVRRVPGKATNINAVRDEILRYTNMQNANSCAALVVMDRTYMRVSTACRMGLAARCSCPIMQVESDVIVPAAIGVTSRDSLGQYPPALLNRFLVPFPPIPTPLVVDSLACELPTPGYDIVDVSNPEQALKALPCVDRSVPAVSSGPWGTAEPMKGGQMPAKRALAVFKLKGLANFHVRDRRKLFDRVCSNLSAYIHYGHISVLNIVLDIQKHTTSTAESKGDFIRQLTVHRESAIQYCLKNPKYDTLTGPIWPQETLNRLKNEYRVGTVNNKMYSDTDMSILERGQTHDPLWNAAQHELIISGKMHSYLRIYWATQILLWTQSPAKAFQIACRLHDKFSLDGHDECCYASIARCFGVSGANFDTPGGLQPYSYQYNFTYADRERYIKEIRLKCASVQCERTQALLPRHMFMNTHGTNLHTETSQPHAARSYIHASHPAVHTTGGPVGNPHLSAPGSSSSNFFAERSWTPPDESPRGVAPKRSRPL